ncbi:MAG: hypothetical protein LLG37_06060 [Spirochaetia bacterium]|nr:hypothetical protein [Spirochaetia bacterium]
MPKNKIIMTVVVVVTVPVLVLLLAKCSKKQVPKPEPTAVPAVTQETANPVTTPASLAASTRAKKAEAKDADTFNVKDFEFKVSEDKTVFEVVKKGEVIMTKEAGDKESFTLSGDSVDKSLPEIGTDLTGDGKPDMVLKTRSEKDSCSTIYSIFTIEQDLELLAEVKGLEEGITFKDLNGDRSQELIGRDCTFLDWWAALGEAPAPVVVLSYLEGSGYVMADELMRADPPDTADLQAKADKAKGKPISYIWKNMLDLIYSGNGDDAWKFYDMAEWNDDWEVEMQEDEADRGKGSKEEYLEAFKEHLSTSPYWKKIKKMNGWEFTEMMM